MHRQNIIIILLVFSCLQWVDLQAQIKVKSYTDGSNVQSIVREGDILWIGSPGGLTRHDTKTNLKEFFTDLHVTGIIIDSARTKWISTQNKGLVRMDAGGRKFYNTSNSNIPINNLKSICYDRKAGKMYLGSDSGLTVFDYNDFTTYNNFNSSLNFRGITSIVRFRHFKFMTNRNSNSFAIYNDTSFRIIIPNTFGLKNSFVVTSFVNELDRIMLIGSNRGAILWDMIKKPTFLVQKSGQLTDSNVMSLYIDSLGRRWIGTVKGGVCLQSGKVWKYFTDTNSTLPAITPALSFMMMPGKMWIGTNQGLRFNTPTFTNSWLLENNSNSGINVGSIRAVNFDKSNRKWFVSENYLFEYDGFNIFKYQPSLGVQSVNEINFMGDSAVLVATANAGLFFYNRTKKEWREFNASNGLNTNVVNSVISDDSNNIYIGTNNGLVKYRDGKIIREFDYNNSPLPISGVKKVMITKDYVLWISTNSGLYSLTKSIWKEFSQTDGLPTNLINQIAITTKGIKWIATTEGLVKFNDTAFVTYNVKNGSIPDNDVTCVTVDAADKVYFGMKNQGLMRFRNNNFRPFNTLNSDIRYNSISTIKVDRNGLVWMGYSQGGLTELYDDNILWVGTEESPILKQNNIRSWINGGELHIINETKNANNYQLMDISGRILSDKNIQNGETGIINVDYLPRGLYIIRMVDNGVLYSRKVVK